MRAWLIPALLLAWPYQAAAQLEGRIGRAIEEKLERSEPHPPSPHFDWRTLADTPGKRMALMDFASAVFTSDLATILNTAFANAEQFKDVIRFFADRGGAIDVAALPPQQRLLIEKARQVYGKEYEAQCGPYLPKPAPGQPLKRLFDTIPIPTPPAQVSELQLTCIVLWNAGVLAAKIEMPELRPLGRLLEGR